jgi:hypothetical protein
MPIRSKSTARSVLAGFALRRERVEFMLEPFLGGFAGVDRAALAARLSPRHGGRRSGAGLGDITRRRSPLRLGPAGYDRQAQFKFTRRRSTICHYGRPRPPSFGLSGPFVSSHRTRVRKASQRGCPRRRSPSAWPGSIIIAKPAPILLTGGQRNVSAPGQEIPSCFPRTGWALGPVAAPRPWGLAAALSYLSEGERVSSWFS